MCIYIYIYIYIYICIYIAIEFFAKKFWREINLILYLLYNEDVRVSFFVVFFLTTIFQQCKKNS